MDNFPFLDRQSGWEIGDREPKLPDFLPFFTAVLIMLVIVMLIFMKKVNAEELKKFTASWYSVESLKQEGTWNKSKGVMANGKHFDDNANTCASNVWPLSTVLLVCNPVGNVCTVVKVTDRMNKRFTYTRIDLSKKAFSEIADLKQGVVPVTVEVMHD